MDILINVVLPLSLAIIMLSLGVGLTFGDFGRVVRRGWAFCIGATCQVLLVPLVAYAVVKLFDFPGELAVGFMLLSVCPGGVTSNMLSKLARGDVALSVSLTAVISLLSIVTFPFVAAWSVAHFIGEDAPDVSVTNLAIAMFLITTLPVLIGVLFRHFATALADQIEPILSAIATFLFILIVLAALAGNWGTFVENVAAIGPALILLSVTLMLLGLIIAGSSGLTWEERKTISVETGIQNATIGITMAALITGVTTGFSTMALPSAVYGIIMYLVVLPFILWFRSR